MGLPVPVIVSHVAWTDWNLWHAVAFIICCPFYWNFVTKWEHHTQSLSRLLGSRELAYTLLSISVLFLGFLRDTSYRSAVISQPKLLQMQQNWILWTGHFLVLFGIIFVISAFRNLGFHGTFLGDLFGTYQPYRSKRFPFNWLAHPVHWGSAMMFMGYSLVWCSFAGMMLSLLVAVMYKFAIWWEEPYSIEEYEMALEEKEMNS